MHKKSERKVKILLAHRDARRAYYNNWWRANKEKRYAIDKRWREAHPLEFKKRNNENSKKMYYKNREKRLTQISDYASKTQRSAEQNGTIAERGWHRAHLEGRY